MIEHRENIKIRECKDIDGQTIYEISKWCNCENCRYRMAIRREPANYVYAVTYHKKNIDKLVQKIKEWVCNSDKGEERIKIVEVSESEVFEQKRAKAYTFRKTQGEVRIGTVE